MSQNKSATGEEAATTNFHFGDKTVRKAFFRKVYLILMVQLLISAGIISIFVLDKSTQEWVQNNPVSWIGATIMAFVLLCVIGCFESARRNTPSNYILLLLFTLAQSFLLGVVSASYEIKEVLLAVGICVIVCFALSIFAFQTKIDFTALRGVILVALIIMVIFGLVLMYIPNIKTVNLIYACFGALVFSAYLIFDTQLMIGGNYKYSISPEEYIFAALSLYVDVINIFLIILRITGETRN